MTDLFQCVEQNVLSRKLFSRGQKILVAVSGGIDSMVLLQLLEILSAKHKWEITVAHFNHQLRGRDSGTDEKLVRKIAAKLKLPIIVESADVKSFAKKSKLSVEMAARKLRHEFFARVARERKIKTIALAHHADDQVELFFLRLLRGAGGEGLAGMKWKSPSPVDQQISLVRPLLNFSKNELAQFADENKIQFREDVTNRSSDFLRNRIRNGLLPLLRKKYQPALSQTVLRLMEIVGAESDFLSEMARQFSRGDLLARQGARQRIPIGSSFEKLPAAIQRRILQMRLAEKEIAADFDLIESLRQAANQFVSIGSKISVARNEFGEIKLRAESKSEFNANELEMNLAGRAGEMIFGGMKFKWKFVNDSRRRSPHQKNSNIEKQIETFDADKIGDKIILRHWRAGDRFQPIGLKSLAKLQDLFTNAKIPREHRHDLILAAALRGEIFWVEGLRISENFKLTPKTKRRLIWNWQR